jgi:hypothetical protein
MQVARFVMRLVAVCLAFAALAAGPAEARRVALVIGNADYRVGPLQNPVKDAAAVAEAFEALHFDKIILKQNLAIDGFRAALGELARETADADLGVVYFAGHGVEVGGRNFLIPVDAVLARQGDLDLQAVALDTVIAQLAGVTSLKLVILDACRTNVFPLAGAKRSVGRGFSPVKPEDNTLVVYAAKDGTTADDGAGRAHSPFTEALLKHITVPDVEVRILFGRVRDDVLLATRSETEPQQPYVYGSLGGRSHYLQSVDPANDSPVAQRIREQERQIAKAVAAAKAANEKLHDIELRLKGEGAPKADKAVVTPKREQAPPARATASAPAAAPAGGSCSDARAACTQACQGGGSFSECESSCRARYRACLSTGAFTRGLVKQ